MSVEEIKAAISRLSRQEREQVRAWLDEFEAEEWDRQIEADVKAERFDALMRQAEEDFKAGRCRPL